MSANELVRIVVVVDVVAALASETLAGAVWLVDSNKSGGSSGAGTSHLTTTVKKGDRLIWTAMSLEAEAFAAIVGIEIDRTYCEVSGGVYDGTNIRYWLGKIKKDPGTSVVPYNVQFQLGSSAATVSLPGPDLPGITGGRSD